jgi:carbonic anhydrase
MNVLLNRLIKGNNRFIEMKNKSHFDYDKRFELVNNQNPFVAILSCSDSRVPLEIIFDQGFGDIFVVRNAGNIADANAIGSLAFAVGFLGVKLIVVMGHESCGAVDATIKDIGNDIDCIKPISYVIKPSVEKMKQKEGDLCYNSTVENVHNSIAKIKESGVIANAIEKNGLEIVSAFYSLQTGVVSFGV